MEVEPHHKYIRAWCLLVNESKQSIRHATKYHLAQFSSKYLTQSELMDDKKFKLRLLKVNNTAMCNKLVFVFGVGAQTEVNSQSAYLHNEG